MKQYFSQVLALCLITCSLTAQDSLIINKKGNALKNTYLSMGVETGWIAGHHIDWATGQSDKPNAKNGTRTHCSAFVAAACKQNGIYILRPPEHAQELLASAQYDWLQSAAGASAGWHQIENTNGLTIYFLAQDFANKGFVVAAVYKNTNPKLPGHIALVMPTAISKTALNVNGPAVIMASTHNFNSIFLRQGFNTHITQWPEPAIAFFIHDANRQ